MRQLLQNNKNNVATLFVSDLHLDPDRSDATATFIRFLDGPARDADRLYILGDLFEVWIGDDDPNSGHQRAAPCWPGEGTPHFAGLTVGTDSYDDYLKIRAQQVWGDLFSPRPRIPSFDDFSPSKIVEYYDTSMPCAYPPEGNYALGYSLGFLTLEALSAIGGSDSSMNVYKLMKDKTFPEAFELTYSSSWDEAKHILASVVSANIFDIKNNIAKYR